VSLTLIAIAWALVALTVAIHTIGLVVLLARFAKVRSSPPTGFWRVTGMLIRIVWALIFVHAIEISVWALFYLAAHHTTAVNITILQGSMPVFVLVGALLFYGTRIRGWQIAGMAVTLLGALLVATRADLATLTSFSFNVGDLWMLVACCLYAGFTVALRKKPAIPGLGLLCNPRRRSAPDLVSTHGL